MEKNEKNVLERNLEQKAFENAAQAIKGGNDCSHACCNYEGRI